MFSFFGGVFCFGFCSVVLFCFLGVFVGVRSGRFLSLLSGSVSFVYLFLVCSSLFLFYLLCFFGLTCCEGFSWRSYFFCLVKVVGFMVVFRLTFLWWCGCESAFRRLSRFLKGLIHT